MNTFCRPELQFFKSLLNNGLLNTFWRPRYEYFLYNGLLNTFRRLGFQLFKSLVNNGLLNTFCRPGFQLFQSLLNNGLLNTFCRPRSFLKSKKVRWVLSLMKRHKFYLSSTRKKTVIISFNCNKVFRGLFHFLPLQILLKLTQKEDSQFTKRWFLMRYLQWKIIDSLRSLFSLSEVIIIVPQD